VTPEGKIENEIFAFLRELGVLAIKHDSVGIFDPVKKIYRKSSNKNRVAGVSDILGIILNRPFAIEVKSKTGKLTPEQRVFLRWFQEHGGIAFVARSARDVQVEFSKHFPDSEEIRKFNQ
jgi:hypothetical protein